MRRVRGEEPPERRDAEVQLRVVGRLGDAVGPGDLVEGAGAGVGGLPGVDLLEVARQVGPGQPGRERLAGGELGFAEFVADGGAVGPLGILAQVRLEVVDGAGVVARLLAGAAHREEERGAEGLALGERAPGRAAHRPPSGSAGIVGSSGVSRRSANAR